MFVLMLGMGISDFGVKLGIEFLFDVVVGIIF